MSTPFHCAQVAAAVQKCQRRPRESPAMMLLYPRASPERHSRVSKSAFLPCPCYTQPGRDNAAYLDLEDLRVKADCDQHCRIRGYVRIALPATAVYWGSSYIPCLLDDSMTSFCMRNYFGHVLSFLSSQTALPFNRLTLACRMLTSAHCIGSWTREVISRGHPSMMCPALQN